MDDDEPKDLGSTWKPNWKKLLGEGYAEIFKAILLGIIAFVGVLLSRGFPVVGAFVTRPLPMHFYQLILWIVAALVTGICVDRLLVGNRLRTLKDDAAKDELTGLMNLRSQRRILPAAMRQANERQKAVDAQNRAVDNESLCAIVLDIDDFKQVNATTSFESGSFVLQQFAELLKENRKVTDQVFRIGGDEFLILAPRTPQAGAVRYAEKLRGNVATTKFKVYSGKPDIALTMSAGVAEIKYPEADTPKALLERANDALSRAKLKKNSVEIALSTA